MSKSVFITGATGLVGAQMVKEYLANGYNVFANVSSKNSDISRIENGATIVTNNFNNFFGIEETIKKVDVVIHCAAYVTFNTNERQKVLQKNVEWTKHIVNLCLEYQKELIHISSIAKYDFKSATITEKTESVASKPFSGYADSKYYSELEVWRGIAEGLNAIILNPGIILGSPKVWNEGSGVFWQRLNNGLKYYPTGTCGFVDVKDVAKASRLLLEQEAFNQEYILTENTYSYEEIFKEIAQSIHKKTTFKPITKPKLFAILSGLRVATFLRLNAPISEYDLIGSFKQLNHSNQKIKDTIHIEFTPIKETIARVSEEFLKVKT